MHATQKHVFSFVMSPRSEMLYLTDLQETRVILIRRRLENFFHLVYTAKHLFSHTHCLSFI